MIHGARTFVSNKAVIYNYPYKQSIKCVDGRWRVAKAGPHKGFCKGEYKGHPNYVSSGTTVYFVSKKGKKAIKCTAGKWSEADVRTRHDVHKIDHAEDWHPSSRSWTHPMVLAGIACGLALVCLAGAAACYCRSKARDSKQLELIEKELELEGFTQEYVMRV